MEPKLCGKCCQPRCAENAHSQRHSARGRPGRISKEQRWNAVWRRAHRKALEIWKNVPLQRHMKETGSTFGSIRYSLMRKIHDELRGGRADESGIPLEAAVAMPPREQEEMVETIREAFGEDDMLPLPLETSMTLDDDADPEDPDASWRQASDVRTSSSARASSGEAPLDVRPLNRGAVDVLVEETSPAMSSLQEGDAPPPWNPMGQAVLDEGNRECSHYRRRYPPLNSVSWSGEMTHATGEPTRAYLDAELVLRRWLAMRPGLTDAFRSCEVRSYPWRAGPGECEVTLIRMHSWGVYLYCELNEWSPRPRCDIDVGTLRSSLFHDTLEPVIHASSMYSVHRTIMGGLKPGPLLGKGGMLGVYCYRPCGLSNAVSSSGYAVYSWIGGSFLASPRYDIVAETYRAGEPGVGKISVGDGQLCMKNGMYFVRGVFFHVLSRRDVARGPPTWVNWDDWIPEHELPPS